MPNMQRRSFARAAGAALMISSLALAGCSATATSNTTPSSTAKTRSELDASAAAVLPRLYASVPGSKELVEKSVATLVFPNVVSAGLGIGGQFGEGVLRSGDTTLDYYNIASLSVGLQAGAQSKAIVFLFMTKEALEKLRHSDGWSAGADASVAVLKTGANGSVDVSNATGPILAFVLTNAGLMANLTLEGTKITRLKR